MQAVPLVQRDPLHPSEGDSPSGNGTETGQIRGVPTHGETSVQVIVRVSLYPPIGRDTNRLVDSRTLESSHEVITELFAKGLCYRGKAEGPGLSVTDVRRESDAACLTCSGAPSCENTFQFNDDARGGDSFAVLALPSAGPLCAI